MIQKCRLLLYTQIIANERTDIIFSTFFNLVPIAFVIIVLLPTGQTHKNQVADLVTFAQIQAS